VDSAGRLWVADFFNNRVLRFDGAADKANGANADGVLGQPNFTSNGAATTASGMNSPGGLAIDTAGHLWVADNLNSRVLRFDGAPLPALSGRVVDPTGQPFASPVRPTLTPAFQQLAWMEHIPLPTCSTMAASRSRLNPACTMSQFGSTAPSTLA